MVPPRLVSPAGVGCSTQIPLLFRQGWFRNEMRTQRTVDSVAAFTPVTHCTPSVEARAGSSPEELCPPPPPFPILGLTPNLIKEKWKKLKC